MNARDAGPAPSGCLTFRGNRGNPNYPAVAHLLRVYAAHLGAALEEVGGGAAHVHWDMPEGGPPGDGGPCLVFPGRPAAVPELVCERSPEGYPMPRPASAGPAPGATAAAAAPGGTAAPASPGAPAHARLPASASPDGRTLAFDRDLLSFCADILFRRADHLPGRGAEAREALGAGRWDEAFGLKEEPWVDRWMFRLLGGLPFLAHAVEALPRRASVWLTHDLDNLAKWRLRSVAGQALRTPLQIARGRFRLLARNWGEIAARAATGRDPYDVMGRILAMERGRRSANFFLAHGRDHLFHRYEISEPRFLKVLRECQEAGMDVGLHGQVDRIADPAAIRAEKEKLEALGGRPVVLNRQHYLRWDAARTFPALAQAGIRVDSTLGYNDMPGFRCGTALPFPWFDCAADRTLPLLEVPLVLAEFQFYDPRCFDGEAVRAVIRRYLDAACLQGGVFTALFHNQYFHEAEFPGHGEVYRDLLRLAADRALPDFDPDAAWSRYCGGGAVPSGGNRI
jgi:hypothetical protein